jgi:hypothetical protein
MDEKEDRVGRGTFEKLVCAAVVDDHGRLDTARLSFPP